MININDGIHLNSARKKGITQQTSIGSLALSIDPTLNIDNMTINNPDRAYVYSPKVDERY